MKNTSLEVLPYQEKKEYMVSYQFETISVD